MIGTVKQTMRNSSQGVGASLGKLKEHRFEGPCANKRVNAIIKLMKNKKIRNCERKN